MISDHIASEPVRESKIIDIEPAKPFDRSISKQKRRGKLNMADIDGICELVSKRITEEGACLILNVSYDSFRRWKSREGNQAHFASEVIRLRELKIRSAIDNIQEASEAVNLKTGQRDWRASGFLLQKVYGRERFDDKTEPVSTNVNVNFNQVHQSLKQVFESRKQIKLPQRGAERLATREGSEATTTSEASNTNPIDV